MIMDMHELEKLLSNENADWRKIVFEKSGVVVIPRDSIAISRKLTNNISMIYNNDNYKIFHTEVICDHGY